MVHPQGTCMELVNPPTPPAPQKLSWAPPVLSQSTEIRAQLREQQSPPGDLLAAGERGQADLRLHPGVGAAGRGGEGPKRDASETTA